MRPRSLTTPPASTSPPRQITRVARYVSIIGHPFIVLPAAVYTSAAMRSGEPGAGVQLAIMFGAVSLGILLGIRTGRFNNFDVSDRERRPRFYLLVTAATLALGLWHREEPETLRACLVAGALLMVSGAINRWVKVSLHTAFALYAAGLLGAWSVTLGLLALAFAPAIAWSRVHLGRHSLREVVFGAIVGLVAGGVLLGASVVLGK
jgi:membrane-associated phospholipid phosphatase